MQLIPPADRVVVLVRDAQDQEFVMRAVHSRAKGAGEQPPVSRTVVRDVAERREAVLLADAGADHRYAGVASVALLRLRCVLCAPLIAWGEVIGVVEVSGQATDTARRILDLREVHRLEITAKLGRAAGNGHRVLEHLYEHPIVSVAEVKDLIGTTYPAANELVARMVDLDVLHEITGQARNRKFIYRNYIRLFSDAETEAGA